MPALLLPLAWIFSGVTVGAGVVYATSKPTTQNVYQAQATVDQRQGLSTGQMILGAAVLAAGVYFIAKKG